MDVCRYFTASIFMYSSLPMCIVSLGWGYYIFELKCIFVDLVDSGFFLCMLANVCVCEISRKRCNRLTNVIEQCKIEEC